MRERRWWDSTWAGMVFCGLVALVTLQVLDGKLDAGGFVEASSASAAPCCFTAFSS